MSHPDKPYRSEEISPVVGVCGHGVGVGGGGGGDGGLGDAHRSGADWR